MMDIDEFAQTVRDSEKKIRAEVLRTIPGIIHKIHYLSDKNGEQSNWFEHFTHEERIAVLRALEECISGDDLRAIYDHPYNNEHARILGVEPLGFNRPEVVPGTYEIWGPSGIANLLVRPPEQGYDDYYVVNGNWSFIVNETGTHIKIITYRNQDHESSSADWLECSYIATVPANDNYSDDYNEVLSNYRAEQKMHNAIEKKND